MTTEHTPFDYMKLQHDLTSFFVVHSEVDPEATPKVRQVYDLLVRAHEGVIQYSIDLEAHHSETEQAHSEFQKETHTLKAKIKKLQERIKEGFGKIHGDLTKTKSEKLPDPERYRRDRNGLKMFQRQQQIKLSVNLDRFPTSTQKIAYSISRLEGPVTDQFLAYVSNDRIALESMSEILEILDNAFGDPDRVATAAQNLRKLDNGNTLSQNTLRSSSPMLRTLNSITLLR